MEVTLSKWGTSFGIRIPAEFLRKLQLKDKDIIDCHLNGNKIVIEPILKNEYNLTDLLVGIENQAPLIEFGEPAGSEIL
jgi:antitoxin MazE